MNNENVSIDGNGLDSSISPRVSPSAQEREPKFSFVMIALNAMPFIEYSLKSVYDFAHEIIIVEGAVENCLFAANPDGGSKDGTVEFIKSFPDPENKITLIQGRWPEKCEMQNEALKHVSGDYVWLIDSDEVYKRNDLDRIKGIVKSDPSITQVNFIPDSFWKGPDHIVYSSKFFEFSNHFRRLFKFVPGAVFISHRPPTMVWPGCNRTTEQMHLLGGTATREMGVILYHYNYVLDSQVKQKNDYYGRMDKKGDFWGFDRQAWYKECFLKWNPQNRERIERRYPVWLGDEHSHTQPFTGTHPDVMSNFIAGFGRKVSAGPGTNRPCQPVLKAAKKNALVSYITAPLRMGPQYQPFMFSNAGIARSMVKVLVEMGYVVDLIDWNCMDFESDKTYDLFIGHAGANWEYLSRNVVRDAIKIYFATGIYWRQFNRQEAERFDRLEERRGVRLPYDRRIEFSEEFAVHDADGIICLGNKNAAASYRQFPVCFNLNNACYGDDHYDAAAKDFDAGRRHFLYFGSGGNIHKGLGLLVEAFMQLDAELWCAGPVEPGFAEVYKEALPKHRNIHFVSWVELRSPRFYELMTLCNSTIFVSCAEGSPGGVIECMNQGLIPIVNREANIDVDDFGIMLQDDSIDQIVRVVREVMAKPAQWHYEHLIKTRQAALRDYSQQTFEENMRRGIEHVISKSQQVRAEQDRVASQVTVNFDSYTDRWRSDLGALLRGADRLKSLQRNDEAAQLWQRVLVVEPSCMTAMCELAAYYADKGQSDKARGIAKRVMKLCPLDEQCRAVLQQTESTSSCYVVSNSLRTSVAIPCARHHVRYLDNALSKIARGTEVPDEVVIVVSPVEGQEQLDRLNRLYEKFKDIFALEIKWCEQRLDAASARERLTESLNGDVILYHDADDTQHPQRLEIVKRFFKEHDIVHLCHSYTTFSEGEAGEIVYDNIQTAPSQELYEKYFVQGPMPKAFGAGFMRTHAGALCIRREVLQKVAWAGLVQGVEDREFCLNVLKTFNKSILIDAPLLNYNTSDERKMDIETNDIRVASELQPLA